MGTSVEVYTAPLSSDALAASRQVLGSGAAARLRSDPAWLEILEHAFGHKPYLLIARRDGLPVGTLNLALVESRLFGRFLISLPYVNSAGVVARDDAAANALIERAAELADELDVRYLELRHEAPREHARLGQSQSNKCLMRLKLPADRESLWNGLRSKYRNKLRKAQSFGFEVRWGGMELSDDFYQVFAHTMRDLGTPVYGKRLFRSILTSFPDQAEICTVRDGGKVIAAALLLHWPGVTEIPSAASLHTYNPTNANMLMYLHALERAVERGQSVFDFGRCTIDGNTFTFKKGWGAEPEPTYWQYYLRRGTVGDMRPENRKYRTLVRVWQRLPVCLTRAIGPMIIRGIP
jgi:serine/alanine adding enzyme